jgi:hypothetical protein
MIIICVIVAILITLAVISWFLLHRPQKQPNKKILGSCALAEMTSPSYIGIFTLDGRFIVLFGKFGDNLTKSRCLRIEMILDLTNFFNLIHDPALTTPNDHMRCCRQLAQMFLSEAIGNRAIIYCIEGYLVDLPETQYAEYTVNPEKNYVYTTPHISSITDNKYTTARYEDGENSSYEPFYIKGFQPIKRYTVINCAETAERKLIVKGIYRSIGDQLNKLAENCNCKCITFFRRLIHFLTTEYNNLEEYRYQDCPRRINHEGDHFRVVKYQTLYSIGSFMIRALYDGMLPTKMEYLGAGNYNLVYRISDTKVLRIYIHSMLNWDTQGNIPYEDFEWYYNRFKNTEDIINNELKTFTSIEMMNVHTYEISADVTGKYITNIRVFSMYLISEYHHTFSVIEIINSPTLVRDILNVKRDLNTLFAHNYAYADFKYPNFLLHRETKELLIGDIDVDPIDNRKFLVSTYKFDNDNLDISLLETVGCFYSVCYICLLMFVINILSQNVNEKFFLSELLEGKHVAFRILLVVVKYKNLYDNWNKLNILKYDKFWEFILCMFLKYMYEKKIDQIDNDFQELLFIYYALNNNLPSNITPPASLGEPAKKLLKFKSTEHFCEFLDKVNEWSETALKELDFSAYGESLENTQIAYSPPYDFNKPIDYIVEHLPDDKLDNKLSDNKLDNKLYKKPDIKKRHNRINIQPIGKLDIQASNQDSIQDDEQLVKKKRMHSEIESQREIIRFVSDV